MTLKLFYAPGACSLASHIALEETGEPYEAIRVDLMRGEQNQPAFRAINPRGKVPALISDQGVLTESPAILAYIAGRRPELDLLPVDPFERAQALSLMAWLSSSVHVAFGRVWHQGGLCDEKDAWPGIRAKAQSQLADHFAEIDHRLDGAIWLFSHFTVVDPYVLVMRRWGARIGLDMEQWPHLVAHSARVASRPSAERVLAVEGIRVDG